MGSPRGPGRSIDPAAAREFRSALSCAESAPASPPMPAPRFRPLPLLVLLAAAGPAVAEAPPRFPPGAVWHQDIRAAAVHPQSEAMIATWTGLGGFGNARMQIDLGFKIVHAAPDAPLRTIVGYPGDEDYYLPDCEP